MDLKYIHYEKALPPMAEMGLEHIIAPLIRGLMSGNIAGAVVGLDEEKLAKVFMALASGAESKAARRLIAICRASVEDLESWELDASKQAEAIAAIGRLEVKDALSTLSDFFGLSGLSLKPSPDSSEPGKEETVPASPSQETSTDSGPS